MATGRFGRLDTAQVQPHSKRYCTRRPISFGALHPQHITRKISRNVSALIARTREPFGG